MRDIFVIIVLVLAPLAALAMTPLTDDELSAVRSQAGISINPDITMDISIDVLAWGDEDGLEPGPSNPWGLDTDGGYAGITDLHMESVQVRLRTDPDDHYNGYDAATMCKPMTIDVGTRSIGDADVTSVRIGTGALQLSVGSAWYDIGLGTNP